MGVMVIEAIIRANKDVAGFFYLRKGIFKVNNSLPEQLARAKFVNLKCQIMPPFIVFPEAFFIFCLLSIT